MANTWYSAFGEFLRPTLQNIYIGLILSNGVEVSGGGYSRVQCNSLSVTEDSNYIYVQNNIIISFPVATTDWATASTYPITQVGLFGTLTGNSLLGTYTIGANRYCYTNDQIIIPINSHRIYFNKSV
jgi:hypothetical protein